MPWDNDKSTAADPDNPQADEQLTADEWDNHVSEGHFPGDELNFGVDGNGDPVITDPQNSGQTVMRYDRSAGSWVVDALEAGTASINNHLSQNPTELIGYQTDSSTTGVTLTFSDVGLWDGRSTRKYYVLEVLEYKDSSSPPNSLNVAFEGVGNGNYNYQTEDEKGSFVSSTTGADEYELISPTANNPPDRHLGRFKIQCGAVERPTVSQIEATPSNRGEGNYLINGNTGTSGGDSNADIVVSAAGDVKISIALWEVQERGQI